MSFYELGLILEELGNVKKEELENIRTLSFFNVLPHSNKGLKITDIIQFPWDNDKVVDDIEISNETKNRLEIDANDLINIL